MYNFVAQRLNRGAVIFGLPDVSGKARPMVLLNDLRPNNKAEYGMTLNALQIQSGCFNRYELPIKLRWDGGLRTSFISTLHTLQFTNAEILNHDVEYVGIIPEHLLDLAIRIYTAWIRGDLHELTRLAVEIKVVRLEFMQEYDDASYIDYRDTTGGTIRLWKNGDEEIIRSSSANSVRTGISGNSGNAMLGKDIQRIRSDKRAAVKITSKSSTTPENDEIRSTKDSMDKREKYKKDVFGWKSNVIARYQSNEALIAFMKAFTQRSAQELREMCGYANVSTIYHRRTTCIEEIYRRYDSGDIELTDDELKILLKTDGGGVQSPC